MKTLSLNCLLFVLVLSVPGKISAQFVTIPDPEFVSALILNNIGPALSGNQLDTTHTLVTSATVLHCSGFNIMNLDGIQYFDNLLNLDCQHNTNLTTISALPVSLDVLNISECGFTTLPNLPAGLRVLNCMYNQIPSISSLPPGLEEFYGQNIQLTSLGSLPPGLINLDCSVNQLTSLPPLPATLQTMNVEFNQLTSLPSLPAALLTLICSQNMLTSLPSLPPALNSLSCISNDLTSLPVLPLTLGILNASDNQISVLPVLPASVQSLSIQMNNLNSLPALPAGLYSLLCGNNNLSSLPILPSNLGILICSSNPLNSLPALPSTLQTLGCGYNQLTSLPLLPQGLTVLQADANQLTSIPELPSYIYHLSLSDNPSLNCLPMLEIIDYFYFNNTGVQCLPNYPVNMFSTPDISTLPLCGPFNANNCDYYYNIFGQVYSDANTNCVNDPGEPVGTGFKINVYQGGNLLQQVYTTAGGDYTIDTQLGTYDYSVDTTGTPFIVTCPASGQYTSTISVADSTDTGMDFGLECEPGFDVGVTAVLSTGDLFFPGNSAVVNILAGDMSLLSNLNCSQGVAGTIEVIFTGPVQYAGNVSGSLTPTVGVNTLTYNIADFGTLDPLNDLLFYLVTDTTATAGSLVCITVNVTPLAGDNDESNNSLTHCFEVVNSMDPNDKQVSPLGEIIQDATWLTYTIRFQNTGTAPAQNIVIRDTLDADLQESTFTLLATSHNAITEVTGNVVSVSFPNINLVDSTSNEPASHGYFVYKIKSDDNLSIGTTIENSAGIYFDFNAPVITNTTESVVGPTSVTELKQPELNVYPNPAKDELYIKTSLVHFDYEISDVAGRMVLKGYNQNEKIINVTPLVSGCYFLKVNTENAQLIRKFMVVK